MLDLRRVRKALWEGRAVLWTQIDMFACLRIRGRKNVISSRSRVF
jgi:hypothetical protein